MFLVNISHDEGNALEFPTELNFKNFGSCGGRKTEEQGIIHLKQGQAPKKRNTKKAMNFATEVEKIIHMLSPTCMFFSITFPVKIILKDSHQRCHL